MTTKLLLATFFSFVLSVPAARACGGFFCTTVPMNQVAENILFIQGEGTVTTHVQIQYSGTARGLCMDPASCRQCPNSP